VLEKQIFELITSIPIKSDSNNQWCWVRETSNTYTVNTYTVQSTYWALKELPGDMWKLLL